MLIIKGNTRMYWLPLFSLKKRSNYEPSLLLFVLKDLSQFQWKSAHAPKKELPKDCLLPNLTKITQCLYLTPFLISLTEVSFNFEWNGRNFNKLIKSSVKTEGWIVFNLSSHYTCVRFYDPHETLWKGSMWSFQQGKTCS